MKSIRSKLILLFGAVLLFTMLLQMAFNIFYAEDYYISQKSKQINELYQTLRENYTDDSDKLYQLLKPYEEAGGFRVTVLSEKGEMIYITAHDRHFAPSKPPSPMKIRPNFNYFKEDALSVLQKNPMSGEENLVLCGLITLEGAKRYITIETPVASIQATVSITNRFMLLVSFFAILVGILFVWLFSGKLTTPIKRIDKIARNVANLDFSERAQTTKGNDEIVHLSQSINQMSDRLSRMIRDLQRVNEELEQDNLYKTKTDLMRKEFVAHVSHELKTPISLLMGYAEMLKNATPGIDQAFYCDVILDESQKMNRLVCQLLDISRLESGAEPMVTEVVDFNALLDWILEKNRISLETKNLSVRMEGEQCRAECDKMKIEQAMTNYITNAIRHAYENTELIITLSQTEEGLLFQVYNEGNRIEDKDIKKIWNSFYKADESRTDRTSTGLGLYIVKTILHLHGGEVGVKNLEKGVEFWFLLPKTS